MVKLSRWVTHAGDRIPIGRTCHLAAERKYVPLGAGLGSRALHPGVVCGHDVNQPGVRSASGGHIVWKSHCLLSGPPHAEGEPSAGLPVVRRPCKSRLHTPSRTPRPEQHSVPDIRAPSCLRYALSRVSDSQKGRFKPESTAAFTSLPSQPSAGAPAALWSH